MKRRILLVDDDVAVLLTLKAVLELNHFDVQTASSAAEAIEKLASGVYDMVINCVEKPLLESVLHPEPKREASQADCGQAKRGPQERPRQ